MGRVTASNGTPIWVINTPDLKLPKDKRAFKLKFKARSENAAGDELTIMSLDMSSKAIASKRFTITNEWQDFSVSLKGDNAFYVQAYSYTYGAYLDDVEISLADALQPPTNVKVTGYDGTSAKVSWDKVDDAESYVATLYYADYNASMWKPEKEIPTTATSAELTGLDNSKDYAVVITSVKGDDKVESDIVEVTIAAPDGLRATNVKENSFTITWNPVEDIETYYFGCGYYDENGNIVQLDIPTTVTKTSIDVTGVDLISHSYVCQVWAIRGEINGTPTESMQVSPEIAAPLATEATDITDNGFTANWQAVDFGQKYTVNVYKEFEASATSPYALLSTDFDDITEGSIYNPVTYSEYPVGNSGWTAIYGACVPGMLGLDSSWGSFGMYGYLISPDMDFSRNGGATTIKVNWKGDESADKVTVYYNRLVDGEYEPVEKSVQILSVPKELTEQTITLQGGENLSNIVIMPSTGIVYLDKIEVSTILESGDKVVLLSATKTTDDNSTNCKIDGLEIPENHKIFYNVTAGFFPADGWSRTWGKASNNVYVDFSDGGIVESASDNMPNAFISDGKLHVINPLGESVEVYNLQGALIANSCSGSVMDLHGKGVYIVRIGNSQQVMKYCAFFITTPIFFNW